MYTEKMINAGEHSKLEHENLLGGVHAERAKHGITIRRQSNVGNSCEANTNEPSKEIAVPVKNSRNCISKVGQNIELKTMRTARHSDIDITVLDDENIKPGNKRKVPGRSSLYPILPATKDVAVEKDNVLEGGIKVETMHISCHSDTYKQGHNYAGVIIYQYNGKTEWKTANGTHCKSGYIVIQDTNSRNVKKWKKKEPGEVHGPVYRNAFGESKNDAEIVGEGFAFMDGKLKIHSGVFNNPEKSEFHDDRKGMHKLTEHCVKKIVRHWITGEWVNGRNFEVKLLLEDFNSQNQQEDLYTGPETECLCNIL